MWAETWIYAQTHCQVKLQGFVPMATLNKLTDALIRNAKPKEKIYRLGDGGCLWLYVNPTGLKVFRLIWEKNGKQNQHTIGNYPEISLKRAREVRGHLLERPTESCTKKPTFREIALEWYEKRTQSFVYAHRRALLRRLEIYVFPYIGAIPFEELRYRDLVFILQRIEMKNYAETTKRISQVIRNVCAFAKNLGYTEVNIAADLQSAISISKPVQHRAAITEPQEIGQLLCRIDSCPSDYYGVQYALKILPYVFVRSCELRMATWSEIDLNDALWIIPADHMKMKRDHIVPLSRQTVSLFNELKERSESDKLVFPARRNKHNPISGNLLTGELRKMGYNSEEMCIHGFRSMASTCLNEMGYRSDVIEMQLAHSQQNAVRAAYNRALYLDERRVLMQEWGDYLDNLRNSARGVKI